LNAYKSLLSLDLPIVALNSPLNNANLSYSLINFNCSAADDVYLANLSLHINSTGNFLLNQTNTITGINNNTNFTLNLGNGTYIWNCLAYDNTTNPNFAQNNFTFTIDTINPVINLSYPLNNSINRTSFDIDFYFNVTELYYVQNCSLKINDNVNKTINTSIIKNNYINITTNLRANAYNYSISCVDSFNNIGNSETRNFSSLGDITKPVISSVSSSPSSSSSTITWNTDEITNSTVNYGTNSSNLNSNSPSSSLTKSHSITLSSLSSSTTYYYNVTSCDSSNNCESSSQSSFTTTSSGSGSSGSCGSSGGGGSGGGETPSTITSQEVKAPEITEIKEEIKNKDYGSSSSGTKEDVKALVKLNQELNKGLNLFNLNSNNVKIPEKVESNRKILAKDNYSELILKIEIKNNSLKDFLVYDELPKKFSPNTDNLTIIAEGANISILEKDPIIIFYYLEVKINETKEVKYIVNKKVDINIIDEVKKPVFLVREEIVKEKINIFKKYWWAGLILLALIIVSFFLGEIMEWLKLRKKKF
jgi:hypothetical protein